MPAQMAVAPPEQQQQFDPSQFSNGADQSGSAQLAQAPRQFQQEQPEQQQQSQDQQPPEQQQQQQGQQQQQQQQQVQQQPQRQNSEEVRGQPEQQQRFVEQLEQQQRFVGQQPEQQQRFVEQPEQQQTFVEREPEQQQRFLEQQPEQQQRFVGQQPEQFDVNSNFVFEDRPSANFFNGGSLTSNFAYQERPETLQFGPRAASDASFAQLPSNDVANGRNNDVSYASINYGENLQNFVSGADRSSRVTFGAEAGATNSPFSNLYNGFSFTNDNGENGFSSQNFVSYY